MLCYLILVSCVGSPKASDTLLQEEYEVLWFSNFKEKYNGFKAPSITLTVTTESMAIRSF